MKRKGFTLIELLAVIVILAIIALIASPIVMNIIKSAKLRAFKQKVYSISEAAENYYSDNLLDSDQSLFKKDEIGNEYLSIDLSNKEQTSLLELKGKSVDRGKVFIDEDGNVTVTALEDNLCGQKLPKASVVNMLSLDDAYCYLLTDSSSITGSSASVDTILKTLSDLKGQVTQLETDNKNLTDTVNNITKNQLSEQNVVDKLYPVGSIYISTDLDTVAKVIEKFGGTWERYSTGRTLVGTSSNSGETGGSATDSLSLTVANLPSHSHSFTPTGTIKSTFKGTAVNSGSTGTGYIITDKYDVRTTSPGSNKLNIKVDASYINWQSTARYQGGSNGGPAGTTLNYPYGYSGFENLYAEDNGIHQYSDRYTNQITGLEAHIHSVTAAGTVTSTLTGTASNTGVIGSSTPISVDVLDPYTTVYMYKRTA